MIRKIFTSLFVAAVAVTAVNAQFIVEKNDSTIVNIDGNLKFENPAQGTWSVSGIDVANIRYIKRAMLPVQLNQQAVAQ
ncbi:MAG: hypothetical protein IKK16_01345, partial [Bacteroidaceae bacterium]|nr:hypothetical protein [Bacteroidaceae bacterium]